MKDEKILKEIRRLEDLSDVCKNGLDYKKCLEYTEAKIAFLEGIYKSDKKCGFAFSEEFNQAAINERNNLCITSSALHFIVREIDAGLPVI